MTAPQSFELIARLLEGPRGSEASIEAALYIARAEAAKPQQVAQDFEFRWVLEFLSRHGDVAEGEVLSFTVPPRLASLARGELPALRSQARGEALRLEDDDG